MRHPRGRKHPTRDSLNDNAFLTIDEDLVALTSSWLRTHPDLKPHTIDEMFLRIESIVGHTVERE